MTYGLIISAGKQSRFQSPIPKALARIGNETLLDKNIQTMTPFCDKIYVVCSTENKKFFQGYNRIIIESGKGSGDAVWQALEFLKAKPNDHCYILWGDTYQNERIYNEIQTHKNMAPAIIPCVYEEKPYVQIMKNTQDSISVKFSKFGEVATPGYHDLSLFFCEASILLEKLRQFRGSILTKEGTYIHKHGNEMEFLDVFNETDLKTSCLEIDEYEDLSFNTIEQLEHLIKSGKFKTSDEQQ